MKWLGFIILDMTKESDVEINLNNIVCCDIWITFSPNLTCIVKNMTNLVI